MLALCLSFGIIEEGFVTRSLFDPGYLGLGLSTHALIPGLNIGVWWTLLVLGLHAIWSTAVPIALMEAVTPGNREKSWLGPGGVGGGLALFIAGCVMTAGLQAPASIDIAWYQYGAAGLVVLLLAAGAFIGGRSGRAAVDGGAVPGVWKVGVTGFLAGSIFIGAGYLRDIPTAWASVAVMAAALMIYGGLLWRWARRSGWGGPQVLAAATGLILVYVWFGFLQTPSVGAVSLQTDLIGNAAFSLAALGLLVMCWRQTLKSSAGT
jgi:hypothetical protein